MLARRGDIVYSGQTVDRIGRPGEAFSWEGNAITSKARDTIVVSPADAMVLGVRAGAIDHLRQERSELGRLLRGSNGAKHADLPPPLKIRTPAVVEYRLFLAAEHRALPQPS